MLPGDSALRKWRVARPPPSGKVQPDALKAESHGSATAAIPPDDLLCIRHGFTRLPEQGKLVGALFPGVSARGEPPKSFSWAPAVAAAIFSAVEIGALLYLART